MTFYLIRHGETDWNRQGRFQGIEDIELNETGIAQSKECAGALRGIKADCILTSPLKRAKVTAEIIAAHLGVPPVIVEKNLIERDFGRISGLTPAERDKLLASGEDTAMESFEALSDRLMCVIRGYVAEKKYENILLVSHGASINAILSVLSDGAFGTGKTILKNVCISKVDCDGDKLNVEYYNLTPQEYLETIGGTIKPNAGEDGGARPVFW